MIWAVEIGDSDRILESQWGHWADDTKGGYITEENSMIQRYKFMYFKVAKADPAAW